MIEQIVYIEAELCLVAFGDVESLQQREVIVEGVRTPVRIESHIADLAAGWESQGSGNRSRQRAGIRAYRHSGQVVGERLNRSEPVQAARAIGTAPGSDIFGAGRNVSRYIRAAWSRVLDIAALVDVGVKRKTRSVGQSVGSLPATQEQVRDATRVAEEHLSFADGQFVDHAQHEDLIAVIRVRPPGELRVNREVTIVVSIGVRVGIVRQELQPVHQTLLRLDLQSVVLVAGVVTEVVVDVARTTGWCRKHPSVRGREGRPWIGE